MENRTVRNIPEFHVEFYPTAKRGKKNKIIIDACRFVQCPWAGKDDEYEVMTMYGDGTEIESVRTMDYSEVERSYARMVSAHCPESWKPLIEDLKAAKLIGNAADGEDGGTCNFDSPALLPPEGLTFVQAQACAAAAGIRSHKWTIAKEKLLVLSGCAGFGQGNRRTRGAEAACKYLESKGYTCGMYYQMD